MDTFLAFLGIYLIVGCIYAAGLLVILARLKEKTSILEVFLLVVLWVFWVFYFLIRKEKKHE